MTEDRRFKLERRGEVPETDAEKVAFYRATLELFIAEGLPFLVGGTHAYFRYTGIPRETKDFDVFVRRKDYPAFEAALHRAGYDTELTFPHWLGKVRKGEAFIDLIFSGGNGEAAVDDEWFAHSVDGRIFGLDVQLAAPEEMIWSKTYVMERERYDGADVMHLLLRTGKRLDWDRLVRRFADQWLLLLMQIVKFSFVYPSEKHRIPTRIVDELIERFRNEPPSEERVCRGTMTSRAQYLIDVRDWDFVDSRLAPIGNLSPQDVERWTAAIKE